MLDLGFNSAILADFSFEHVVGFAAEHGFRVVEVMCWPRNQDDSRRYAGVSHIDVTTLDEPRIAHLKYILRTANVRISALGYYPNPLDPDPDKAEFYIEHLKSVVRAAGRLGVPVVTTFVGRDPGKSLEDNMKRFADVWPQIVKVAEESNVRIAIENCPMYFTGDEWPGGKNLAVSPAIWSRMFEIIPSRCFGLNYDPSHLIWQMMDEIKPIYQFKERLFHIHLKDAKIYKDKLDNVGTMAHPLDYHSPKLPGMGDVNWRGFFAALTDVHYRGPVVVEIEDRAYEANITDVKSALLTSRNYIKQFLG